VAEPLTAHGGNHKTNTVQDYNVNLNGGNSTDYLTARIARDRPDILERMKAGTYKSVRAAAIDAGIVKQHPRARGHNFVAPNLEQQKGQHPRARGHNAISRPYNVISTATPSCAWTQRKRVTALPVLFRNTLVRVDTTTCNKLLQVAPSQHLFARGHNKAPQPKPERHACR